MRAMVVGGAGFIGSHLTDRLVADGLAVDVIDDLSHGSLANLAEARSARGQLKFHHFDIAAPQATELLAIRRPDVVYHMAAIPRGRPTPTALARAFAGTLQLLDAVRINRVPKIVVALPASALYGRPANRDLPVKEVDLVPRGQRGVVGRATVDLLNLHREHDGVEFTALALANVYGPRQRPDGGVVAAFAAAAAEGLAPTIFGDGRQTRDFLFVDDAVDALVRAGRKGSGLVVNIGTGEQTPVRELWTLLRRDGSPDPVTVAASPDELPRFAVSPVRARIHLGWSPWTSLQEGLRQL